MNEMLLLLFVIQCVLLVKVFGECRINQVIGIRGGAFPKPASEVDNYYEQFDLDYGINDNLRQAGSLQGFIKTGKLSQLQESDPFFKWLYSKLESGPTTTNNRLKPYFAADFGKRSDLKRGENPKLIIVNRVLKADGNGFLEKGVPDLDLEVREVWQPWHKVKCDFVVRYIIPNRINICEIMEARGRFRSEVAVENKDDKSKQAWANMVFKPTLFDRVFRGKKEVSIKKPLDTGKLF